MSDTRFRCLRLRAVQDDLADDVRRGLLATEKWLPCKYFYDATGMALFEEICGLPEYYLTRAETTILAEHAPAMLDLCPPGLDLVELGSGSARKTRLLIEACLVRQERLTYYPIDIARPALEDAAHRLLESYPGLRVVGLVGEYADGLGYLAGQAGGPRLVAFLGSTVGNFDEDDLDRFLNLLRRSLRPEDRFLLGFDLRKDPATLIAAYDDARGVTARFNRNVLARINHTLGADFDLGAFRHRATFDAARGRIEMRLVSLRPQTVHIAALGLKVDFAEGETLHTENCYKHSEKGLRAILAGHRLEVRGAFADPQRRFCVFLANPS
ncbi:MAG: L-histidine N(alpha)-methyltransferase [Gemmataceae bacterium]|nr:L-histidine N(alpha)-methyltransferase [Gemmataceae bacterium]